MIYFLLVPDNNDELIQKNLEIIKDSIKIYHIIYLKKNIFIYDNKTFYNKSFLNVINKIVHFYKYDKIVFHSVNYLLNQLRAVV